MNIQQIRAQYPQYNELSDGDLAYRLWDKSYKGKIPMGEFADKIDLDDAGFSGMVKFARDSGYEPTSTAFAEGSEPRLGMVRAGLQGSTLGFGDELAGLATAGIQKIRGSEKPFSELADQAIDYERAALEQQRKVSPTSTALAEIGGAIASPANLVSGPAALAKAPATIRAAITGGAQGAAYGLGSGEGDLEDRAGNAVEVAIPSALFGAGGQLAVNLSGRAGLKLADAIKNTPERPSIEDLRTVKNAAYQAVDESGLKFSRRAMNNLYQRAMETAADVDYVPEVDRQTFAALKMLENQIGKTPTIGQLDKLRQGLYKRLDASGGSEVAISGMIDAIDDLIESVPQTNDLMVAARAANSRYKKSELLENAFTQAERQTSASGSGGNILNKYRQAVSSILNNPKKARWFSEVEREQMDKFINGSFSENMLRKIGKLSPDGNGLMAALNLGAVAYNPAMLGVTAAATAAKGAADMTSRKGTEQLLNLISTGRQPAQVPYLPGLGSGIASASAQGLMVPQE